MHRTADVLPENGANRLLMMTLEVMLQRFVPGQRWISDTEADLGLGTVLTVEGRRVTLVYMACGETRVYAADGAPLTRVAFQQGDALESHEGWTLHVQSVTEQDGLLEYHGRRDDGTAVSLPEMQLSNYLRFNKPKERMLAGQVDAAKLFEMRRETLQHRERLAASGVHGLVGGRTSLIPHQLYIAHELANRAHPRVLLADEVGLGKTIEAGMILHHRLLHGRASRVLILLPDSLIHQWLVEMLRRFNLRFSVYDEERCQAIEHSNPGENPFLDAQLVLCSVNFLCDDEKRREQALEAGWDLLVVDEAHHLAWTPEQPSVEYSLVEAFAQQVPGVLLLTATPEQLGQDSHFARLRLLDPDRFSDLQHFRRESAAYEPVAKAAAELMDDQGLSAASEIVLKNLLNEDELELLEGLQDSATPEDDHAARRDQLIARLLDRHGTGRVLFRNTRQAVRGFPERQPTAWPLAACEAYEGLQGQALDVALWPERAVGGVDWTREDPRVEWLKELLAGIDADKVLVICAHAATALELEEELRLRAGLRTAVFHEGLSIVERDRAAAWFADAEGAQLLICSEIGSEGRNFQFAHHLVLFDLPFNPELLEQRIGRLDRIGQRETIQIHVPCAQDSAQAMLYQWYDQGLDAFARHCPAAAQVFAEVREPLQEVLANADVEGLDSLLAMTSQRVSELNQQLAEGRDRLLELNSCRPQTAEKLLDAIQSEDDSTQLAQYMDRLFDNMGVEIEEHSHRCLILRPGSAMHEGFPELPEDGVTITYRRETALAREDMQYLTWEHPMVLGAMDGVLSTERGNTSLVTLKTKALPEGRLYLQALFTLESSAPKGLGLGRFLPPVLIPVYVGTNAEVPGLAEVLQQGKVSGVDVVVAARLIRAQTRDIEALIERAEAVVAERAEQLKQQAEESMLNEQVAELQRLSALSKVNPSIRDDELEDLKKRTEQMQSQIRLASPHLDALRLIVTLDS